MKKIAVLGSTGSIGRQTLDIVRSSPDKFKVTALAAGNNTALLHSQILEFKPLMVCANKPLETPAFASFTPLEVIAGSPDVDIVVIATSGKSGLNPTLKAIEAGKKIALANKEILVMAGEIITSLAKLHNAPIYPVDSEHSAVWQCLKGEQSAISRLLLTASGGPFYGYTPDKLAGVTPEIALKHPTWKMGQKVTIDSATLMNKGLEVIEAHWLFSLPFDQLTVLYHPQSIVHSMVEFIDGSIKAQLSEPDMRLPIQYALTYPARISNNALTRIDFSRLKTLTFEEINSDRFPCLKLAMNAGRKGGTYPTVLCAADELAVQYFLRGAIKFTDIAPIVSDVMDKHENINRPDIGQIMETDEWARKNTIDRIHKRR
jgi:1-deoxy-D-xylulose-5-phosphate reductoisomerase